MDAGCTYMSWQVSMGKTTCRPSGKGLAEVEWYAPISWVDSCFAVTAPPYGIGTQRSPIPRLSGLVKLVEHLVGCAQCNSKLGRLR